jgi:hypothetical protein
MVKIRVNKTEAARRQINVAIRLLFSNEDPVAIHTLVASALRILRDLCGKRKDTVMDKIVKSVIRPGMEKKFWGMINTPANFLKHADRDPDQILDNIHEEVNDVLLFMACMYYQDLGFQYTPEMMALISWYMAIHPDVVLDNAPMKYYLNKFEYLRSMPRKEQLAEGLELISYAKNMPRKY